MAARALGEQGVARVQLHPRLVIVAVGAVARDPHVARRHPAHAAVVVEQHFGGGEAGEDLDPKLLGLARQASA